MFKPKVIWHYGKTGTGKTYKAIEYCEKNDCQTYPFVDRYEFNNLSEYLIVDLFDDYGDEDWERLVRNTEHLCSPSDKKFKLINRHRYNPKVVIICSLLPPKRRLNLLNPVHKKLYDYIDEIYHCRERNHQQITTQVVDPERLEYIRVYDK